MKVICSIHSVETTEIIQETDITEDVDRSLAMHRPAYSVSGFNGACYTAAIKTRKEFEDANDMIEMTFERIRIEI